MWFLVDRKFRWTGRRYERGKGKKWSWRATVSCSKTGSCSGPEFELALNTGLRKGRVYSLT